MDGAMKVCTSCYVHVKGKKCELCGLDGEIADESALIATERVLLWMNSAGDDVVSKFIIDVCDWDKVRDDALGSVANWKSFLDYLARTGRPMTELPDGTRFDDPSLGPWVIDEYLFDRADMLRSID